MENYASKILQFIPRLRLEPKAAKIVRLCNQWCHSVKQPNGGFAIGGETEKYRLLRNDINFTELNHEELRTSVLSLSKVLLLPGLNTVIDADHHFLWAWCGELLLSPTIGAQNLEKMEIKKLFEAAIHAALANARRPSGSREDWERERVRLEQIPHHQKALGQEASLILAYLCFPLLESKLKEACRSYVSSDGQVITEFSVSDKDGAQVRYGPTRGKKRISSLRDLLFLFHHSVAQAELQSNLDQFRDHLQQFDRNQDPYDLIYDWRNQSLHGTTNFSTIGGTLLNLVLLIELYEIKDVFEERKSQCLLKLKFSSDTFRASWSFYPPY